MPQDFTRTSWLLAPGSQLPPPHTLPLCESQRRFCGGHRSLLDSPENNLESPENSLDCPEKGTRNGGSSNGVSSSNGVISININHDNGGSYGVGNNYSLAAALPRPTPYLLPTP